MISGTHVIVYSKKSDVDRAFFRDVLGFNPWMRFMAGLSLSYRRQKPRSIRPMRMMSTNSISCAAI